MQITTREAEPKIQAVPAVSNPKATPSLNADLQPLVNRADMAYQRAEVAITSYAGAPEGSPKRELFDRIQAGERVDAVAQDLHASRGLQVPLEDRTYLQEYASKRFTHAPKIELSLPTPQAARPQGALRTAGYSTPMDRATSFRALDTLMTEDQLHAIEERQGAVNTRLTQTAGVLATLEEEGAQGTPAYEQALKEYEKLRHMAEPNPAVMHLALARSQAQDRLKELETDPDKAATVSPALKTHWATVANAGGVKGLPGGLGTGVPKPAIGGRFAGMENPKDLTLARREVAAVALLAQPGAPNAERMANALRVAPKDLGIDNAALQSMWETRRAQLDAHKAFLNAPASPEPGGALAVKPEQLTELGASGVGPIDLDRAPFGSTGPVRPMEPIVWSNDGKGVGYQKDTGFDASMGLQGFDQGGPQGPSSPQGPEGPAGGDGPVSEGPGAGGPGSGAPGGPTAGGPGAGGPQDGPAPLAPPDFLANRPRRIATVSPETHSASVLEQQIRAVEQATRARIRTTALIAAATVASTALMTSAEVALEVASAPMNPNADPARALLSAGQGMNTVVREVSANKRQIVHERTKADGDIRNLMATHAREQRQHAGEWAEKMSNQMGHLDQIKPGVAALDQAEIAVGQKLMGDDAFRTQMGAARDTWAYDTHLAAANEMGLSSHEGLKAQGQAVALYLEQNRGKLEGKTWDQISQAMADPRAMVNVAATGQRNAMLAKLDATGAYQTVLADLDHQHKAQMIQEASQARLVAAAEQGTLHELVGPEIATKLGAQVSHDHLGTLDQAGTLTAAQLKEALVQKHAVERSIEASWRDFTARAPIHAERVVTGGMDPNRLLAQVYERRGLNAAGAGAETPEQRAGSAMRNHFMDLKAKGAPGVPEGWGDPNTLGGDKVGYAPSAGGGAQALLVGFDPKTNRSQGAAIHLFAGEGVRPSNAVLFKLKPEQQAQFEAAREADLRTAGPRVVVNLDRQQLEALQLHDKPAPGVVESYFRSRTLGAADPGYDKAAEHIQTVYNDAVKDAYKAHAAAQLNADAQLYAQIRTGASSGQDFDWAAATFRDDNASAYEDRGMQLARKESIDKASAMTMVVQLKASSSYGSFHQVVEGNRGHFNYAPHEAALDTDPRRALEGRGDGEGRDFRRMMDQADGVYLAMPDEIRKGRESGVTAFQYGAMNHLAHPIDYLRHKDVNKDFLRELGPKTAQAKAILDDPIRQSQITRIGHTRAAATQPGVEGADRFQSLMEHLGRRDEPVRKTA